MGYKLPRRRYAIFSDLTGIYAVVVRDHDIETAPRWGGFVAWLGGEKPPVEIGGRRCPNT